MIAGEKSSAVAERRPERAGLLLVEPREDRAADPAQAVVVLDGATSRPRVPAAALWSDPQIDRAEAAVLRAWVERAGW